MSTPIFAIISGQGAAVEHAAVGKHLPKILKINARMQLPIIIAGEQIRDGIAVIAKMPALSPKQRPILKFGMPVCAPR